MSLAIDCRARYTGRKEEDMKKDAALGFVVVVVFVAILLVVFCWVDGIPAVNAIASLVDVMR